jgi:F-type H+-transporting ATPase subunit b
MSIDWITVSAQIINFLLLVWLLKRFLYQPILGAMERREERVNARLSEAQTREQAANDKVQDYEEKTTKLEQQRDKLMAIAQQEATQQKNQLLDAARREVNDQRDNWARQANTEKDEFLSNLRRQTAQAIRAIATKALFDLANTALEEQVSQSFLEQLKSLDKDARRTLADTDGPIQVYSASELDSTVRRRLTRTIHDCLTEGVAVEYKLSPELLCGIELVRGNQRLGWNLAEYMAALDSHINEAFSSNQSTRQEEH